MSEFAQPFDKLVSELKKIPGIGAKTAQRMAFYVLGLTQQEVSDLAEAIKSAKEKIFYCSICNNITNIDPCLYCSDSDRNNDILCVVEEPFNIASIEKTGIYNGRYYALLGSLSPLKGIGPDEIKIEKLIKLIEKNTFNEIILATNPTVEGEATALYLVKILKNYRIKLTRLAMGLPVGSDIDYADQVTIKKALEGRTRLT